MARMQRWRRNRPAGEGTAPEAEVVEATTDEEHDEEHDGEHDELGDTVTEPVDEPIDEPDAELDADLEEELVEGGAEDLEEDPEADLETDLEDERDATAERPAVLPAAASGSALSRLLLGGRRPAELVTVQLLQAAHAKQAITTALAMGVAAAVSGRPAREAAIVLLTVLVGQTILGWHNDIVDRQRDQAHGLTGKPVAMGRLSTETLWYSLLVAALLLVPLAITTGIQAGCFYLASVAIGLLGNVLLRTGFFSWWSWAVSFALLPAYLSYGGWGGQAVGEPPEPAIVVLAALLGVGVHFMRAVWGLVADHEDGWTYLPLKLGLKLGATRLLALSTVYSVLIVILLAVVGARVGLSR